MDLKDNMEYAEKEFSIRVIIREKTPKRCRCYIGEDSPDDQIGRFRRNSCTTPPNTAREGAAIPHPGDSSHRTMDANGTTESINGDTDPAHDQPRRIASATSTHSPVVYCTCQHDSEHLSGVESSITIPKDQDHIKNSSSNLSTNQHHQNVKVQRPEDCESELDFCDNVSEVDVDVAHHNAEAMKASLPPRRRKGRAMEGAVDVGGQEGWRTNTPASTYYSDYAELRSAQYSRPVTQFEGDHNRDLVFREAIDLMTERCPSMTLRRHGINTPLVASKNEPFGVYVPRYFYVDQKKPSPQPPLKAWKGYHGNVYFEPIKVSQASISTPVPSNEPPPLEKCSETLQDILLRSKRIPSSKSLPLVPVEKENSEVQNLAQARSMTSLSRSSLQSRKTTRSGLSVHGSRKMSVLDKRAVYDGTNEKFSEDIVWIIGQESTGSLCINSVDRSRAHTTIMAPAYKSRLKTHIGGLPKQKQPNPSASPPPSPSRKNHHREKICKGSNVLHRSATMVHKQLPILSVTGDRYSQLQLPSSPLLRTQTQYSQSSQRCINTPDLLYYGGYDKLPPLEQLRASLKNIEPDNQGNMMHIIPPMERIKFEDPESMTKDKPYVKYSPEIRNSAKMDPRRSRQQQSVA